MEAAISVMLIVADAEQAVDWYRRALGAIEVWSLGSVVGLRISGAPFFVHEINPDNPNESSPAETGVTSTRIELFVDDPEDVIGRAAVAGATRVAVVVEHDAPWGKHRQGGFQDPFGHNWSVGDKSPIGL